MRILITGASSFTGSWFVRALVERGHHVVATFTRSRDDGYGGLQQRRIASFEKGADLRYEIPFGSDRFVALVAEVGPDALCLHGAELTNYRSWDFDTMRATALNTANIRPIFEALASGGGHVVATGSVFEPFEGVGDPQSRAFNPYGLSKHLSFEIFRLEAERLGLPISKFVIPNPFGPLEEPRFTNHVVTECLAGRTPVVGTPAYVRDNIHVDLLAACYAQLIDQIGTGHATRLRPSGYIESQFQFGQRFVHEIGKRLGKPWQIGMADQKTFPEPMIRVNDMSATLKIPGWSEVSAWDALARYYASEFGID